MDSFRRDGLTFDVRDAGPADGEPVVLLHGFPQDSTAWDGMAPGLHQAGLRTLAPDQRGCSPMARPRGRGRYRLRETTSDVLALLDAAGLESAHVVGHDWGGIVGWALAAWYPDRVRTLTALSVPHPAAMTKAMVTSDQALRSSYVLVFQVPFLPERVLLAGGGTALRRALPWSGGDAVGTVRVPTLHVWSTGDAFLGRAATEATSQFVDAPYRLAVLEDIAHWIPELAADRVADLVTTHVKAA